VSNIPSIIGGLIALAAVNRLLDTKPTVVTPLIPPTTPPVTPVVPVTPVIPTPVIKPSFDIKPILPEGAFKITQQQLAAYDPTKKVTVGPSGTMEQALIQVDAIKQGNIKKFGSDLYFGI